MFNADSTVPVNLPSITTIDTHTGGEPLRIVLSDFGSLAGDNLLEKRRSFITQHDGLRTGLMLEPRGHGGMYGAIVLPPTSKDADFDVFFLNTEGYSPMCGHAIIAIAVVGLSTNILGHFDQARGLVLNTPAGKTYARLESTGTAGVPQAFFKNVPSFVYAMDLELDVPSVGKIKVDIAFGGAFYAIVNAADFDVEIVPEHALQLIERARLVKRAVLANVKIEHPLHSELSSLFGVIFTGKAHDAKHHSRNVNIYEDTGIDRCSTGTGLSARCALHIAKGELKLHETIEVESIIGSVMTVQGLEGTTFGKYDAVVPEIGGTAHITGKHELYFDPADPYKNGFAMG